MRFVADGAMRNAECGRYSVAEQDGVEASLRLSHIGFSL